MSEPKLWSVADIAAWLQIEPSWVQRLTAAAPNFPSPFHPGGDWRKDPRWFSDRVLEWAKSADQEHLDAIRSGAYLQKFRKPKHKLYRHFNSAGDLLYIGISVSFFARLKKHQQCAAWWDDIELIRIEHYETREACAEAEFKAIRDEKPLHNIQYQRYNIRSRHKQ